MIPRDIEYLERTMKQKSRNIERDGSGTVTLIPEEPEDMVIFTSCSSAKRNHTNHQPVARIQPHPRKRHPPRSSSPPSRNRICNWQHILLSRPHKPNPQSHETGLRLLSRSTARLRHHNRRKSLCKTRWLSYSRSGITTTVHN